MQDQRIIGTSAPRCVGNTLLLNGRTYSPPYVITAVGDAAAMQAALAAAPLVTLYKQYVVRFGLGYTEQVRRPTSNVGRLHRAGADALRPAGRPGRLLTRIAHAAGNLGTMQVLVVDNYDSFVFNLVQYLGQLGVDAQVWRNDDARLAPTPTSPRPPRTSTACC